MQHGQNEPTADGNGGDGNSTPTWVELAAGFTSAVATLSVTAMSVIAWALDPCGGGGFAGRCNTDQVPLVAVVVPVLFTASISAAAFACVRHLRRRNGFGFAGPLLLATLIPLGAAVVGFMLIEAHVSS